MTHLFTATIITCICSYCIVQNNSSDYAGHLVSNTENAKPVANKFDSSKMLVINAFDAMSLKIRKNKKELFRALDDSIIKWIADDLLNRGKEAVVIPGIIRDKANLDSTVLSFLKKNDAKNAIVITSLNAWFDLTNVEVERNFDKSKTKTANFDICSTISYQLYNEQGPSKVSNPQVRRFFTSRETAGSLLSFGPDIVGKRKHVEKIIRDNTTKLLAEF